MPPLNRLDSLPDGFLDCRADEIHHLVSDCTLITLKGSRQPPLFVSILLHGNETTGLLSIQQVLKQYAGGTLPRDLWLFVGNVTAAREGKRRLDSQPDFNRIWLAQEDGDGERWQAQINTLLRELSARPLFASVDIHNNTGLNPHYGCINRLDPVYLQLARRYSRTVIYFTTPDGVQSKAMSWLCPAVTLECGQVGDAYGVSKTARFIDTLLNDEQLPEVPLTDAELDLFHTTAVVRIPEETSFSMDGSEADIAFMPGLCNLNFEEISAGTPLGRLRVPLGSAFSVTNEDGLDVTDDVFCVKDGELFSSRNLMLSMLTEDARIIRQDCLCYVMERYALALGEKDPGRTKPAWMG